MKKKITNMPITKKRTTYSHNAKMVHKAKIGDYSFSFVNIINTLALGVISLGLIVIIASAVNYFQVVRGKDGVAAAETSVVPNQLTFSDDFNNTRTLGWRNVDEGQLNTSSQWAVVADGTLQQNQDIQAGETTRSAIDKPGTYFLTGNPNWTDYEYSVRVKSSDNDAVGIMFRYQDKDNYYRFSMDKERGYRRLVKKVGGRFTKLAENTQGYNVGQWYTLKVRAVGSNIQVFVDNSLVFNVNDADLAAGKIALYDWGNQSAYFDDVKVNTSVNDFTIAILPDTQYYTESFPEIFTSQTEWIASERSKQNIAFVLHEGDVTNHNTPQEWRKALQSMKVLDGKVPYAIVPGNHDKDYVLFNQYFPVSRYSNLPTFGGTFQPNELEDNYHLFSAGGVDWLVIGLDYGPTDDKLAWARSLSAAYPNRHVIILTHTYLAGDNTLHGSSPTHNQVPKPPQNNGVQIWDKLVKTQPNIQFVFNGHVVSPDGVGNLTSTGAQGNTVYQMLANYQSLGSAPGQMGVNGGNGYLRLIKFYPSQDKVEVKTYSPYLKTYLTDRDNQFTLTGVQL